MAPWPRITSIPVIDVGPLVRGGKDSALVDDPDVAKLVQELDDACRQIGFFYAKGHGIAQELVDEVRALSHEFFSLPDSEKLKIKMTPETGYRGYQVIGENVSNGLQDTHEAIDYFRELGPEFHQLELAKPVLALNQWPTTPKRFREVFELYVQQMQDLSKAILRGIALALGGDPETFEGYRAGDPFWILRVIGYPPNSFLEHSDKQGIGCGEHTDYGLLTVVNQDLGISALQVKTSAGDWLFADPLPGTFVVNIGDMLKIWTNGIYQPTVHRVLNSDVGFRVSVPFFYEPNFDTLVEPLDFLKREEGNQRPVVYGKHLVQKVLTNFG